MGGKGVRVLTTPTTDLGKILACMHGMFIYLFIHCYLVFDEFLLHEFVIRFLQPIQQGCAVLFMYVW